MNDQLLRTFIALVTFDQKIRSLQNECESLSKARSVIDEQKAELHKELDSMKSFVHDLKKDVDEKELAMKVLDQQETEKKRRLEDISNPKEYSFLKNEISSINERQHSHEQGLIEAWDKLDATQKKYNSQQSSYHEQVEQLEHKAHELDQQITAMTKTIEDHETERIKFVQVVPVELLENYEHMRGQVANPVVPVSQKSCSACFYPVPAQDLAILKKGKLLPCKSCYRILYYEETALE